MLGPNFRSNNVRRHICPNFQGFSTNQNYWGCNYTPWTPTYCTTVTTYNQAL